jgi:hypothetical protein
MTYTRFLSQALYFIVSAEKDNKYCQRFMQECAEVTLELKR